MQGFGGADTAFAVEDDVGVRVQLARAGGDVAERDEMGAGNAADGELVRLANVDQGELVALVNARFKFRRGDLRHWCGFRNRSFDAPADAAEFLVINQFVDRRVGSANRAVRVFAEFQFLEPHREGVEKQQAAD